MLTNASRFPSLCSYSGKKTRKTCGNIEWLEESFLEMRMVHGYVFDLSEIMFYKLSLS